MSTVWLAPIHFYRRFISPLKPPCCRFVPTCSEYMVLAVKRYGVVCGTLKGVWRLLRCNPLGKGGYEPVEWGSRDEPECRPSALKD